MPPTVRAGDLAMTRAAHRWRREGFEGLSDSRAWSGHQTEGETAWSAFCLYPRSSRALLPANPLLGHCRKWFRDAKEILDKFAVVGSKAEKGAHIADALWHWLVLNRLNFLLLGINARG